MIPPDLVAQLAPGGRLIMPLEEKGEQRLIMLQRTEEGEEVQDLGGVVFVPMLGGLA